MTKHYVFTAIFVLVFFIVLALVNERRRDETNFQRMSACITAGGSWVEGRTAMQCVMGGRTP